MLKIASLEGMSGWTFWISWGTSIMVFYGVLICTSTSPNWQIGLDFDRFWCRDPLMMIVMMRKMEEGESDDDDDDDDDKNDYDCDSSTNLNLPEHT